MTATVSQLVVPMAPERFGSDRVAIPVIGVRMLRRGSQLGPRCHALVDTGAAWSLANVALAGTLGLTDEDLAAGPQVPFVGVGGGVSKASGVRVDLVLGPTREGGLILPDAWMFFTKATLPQGFDVLLGQRDALERLTLVQRNHPPAPRFVLRFPSTH